MEGWIVTKNEAVTHYPKLDNMASVKLVERLRRVWARVNRKNDVTQVLNEYSEVTGISRKHAIVQWH